MPVGAFDRVLIREGESFTTLLGSWRAMVSWPEVEVGMTRRV